MMAYKWYFVRCQSGREDSIRKQLETRINVKGLQDVVPQILVPFERVTELKGGKRKVVSKKLYPGYLMVQADFSDPEDSRAIDARSVLRETPGFTLVSDSGYSDANPFDARSNREKRAIEDGLPVWRILATRD